MLDLFEYNWQVREDWFKWCEAIPQEELAKQRVGGHGSILRNLCHVINCEYKSINSMKGLEEEGENLDDITSLKEVIDFSNKTKALTKEFILTWDDDKASKILEFKSSNGHTYSFTYEKIMKHIITHEVRHIGQMMVWSRQLNKKPVSCDLIFRDY